MQETENVYQSFNRELRHMLRTHHAVCDNRIKALGLHPAQHMLLMHLTCKKEIGSQKELAEHMHISPAALAVSLGKLEGAGYIAKETSACDSRVKSLTITEEGRRLVADSKTVFDAIDREMFAGITEEELGTVITALQKMHANLLRMKEGEKEA